MQDDEDAKQGLYNWFAQSQRLLTAPRLLIGTLTAALIPYLALGFDRALIVYAVVLVVTVSAGYYGNLVIGGVIGDFLGATIQVRGALRRVVCKKCLCPATSLWCSGF